MMSQIKLLQEEVKELNKAIETGTSNEEEEKIGTEAILGYLLIQN